MALIEPAAFTPSPEVDEVAGTLDALSEVNDGEDDDTSAEDSKLAEVPAVTEEAGAALAINEGEGGC